MSIEFTAFEGLLRSVRGLPALPIAVIDADERHVLQGVCEATEAGYIDPVLIGDETSIQSKLDTMAGARRFRIVHAPTEDAMAEKGVELIGKGDVKALMKGHIHTDSFLHPILLHHLQGTKRISHVFLADLNTYPKLLYITDAAINISPDLPAKMHIVQNAVDFARLLGVETPKVAALSAVEVVNPAIASTVDAACLAKMADRGQIKGAVVDGPLAFDNAISRQAAIDKHIDSPVSGETDILLAPDLESANMIAKQLIYLANAKSAGIAVGARVPIILTSRSEGTLGRLASCALASYMVLHPAKGV